MSEKPQVEQDASRDQPCGAPKSAAPEAQPSGGFTPGPWGHYRHSPLTIVGADGERTVATCGGFTNNRNAAAVDAENAANARLIAAAPDLLEACEALVSDIGQGADPADAECRKRTGSWDKARAAIAKATGAR